jgi:Carboxypeptidase regulatory-like domain
MGHLGTFEPILIIGRQSPNPGSSVPKIRASGTLLAGVLVATLVLLMSCMTTASPSGQLTGVVVSGPSCPIEANSETPSPQCADQPVEGATIIIRTEDRQDQHTAVTDEQGRFSINLDPGTYVLEPQPIDRFPSAPNPQTVSITADKTTQAAPIHYDTGIR